MAGLFKRVYDWLLRLFWLVFLAVPRGRFCTHFATYLVEFSGSHGAIMLTGAIR